MKKVYAAPAMLIENFRLSEHIAVGCAELTNLVDAYANCTSVDEYIPGTGIYVFMISNDNCIIKYDGAQDPGDIPCYHSPAGWNYFTS